MSEWNWIQDAAKRTYMQRFAAEWGMKLKGNDGFSINGVAVEEFSHLLACVTKNKHQTFNRIEAIARDFYAIDSAIIGEMRKPSPCGKNANTTGHDEAMRNLEFLRVIVRCIAQYFKLITELGIGHIFNGTKGVGQIPVSE